MYGSVPGGNTDPGALLCVLEEEKYSINETAIIKWEP